MIKQVLLVAAVAVSAMAMRPAHPAGMKQEAGALVWISQENPAAGARKWEMQGMMGRDRGETKVWPLVADETGAGRCLRAIDGTVQAFDNDMQPVEAEASAKRGCASITIKTARPGRYTLYYTTDKVENGTRYIRSAKYEMAHGRHGDEVELRNHQNIAALPFELVRIKDVDEGLFTRFYSGDTLTFRTMYEGKPLPGVAVELRTGSGWARRAVSDADALVSFTLIKEYFPAWNEFDKRHQDHFVVSASLTQNETNASEGGAYDRRVYLTTYPGSFFPEPTAYKSYAFALAFGTAALVLTWIIVYFYRRRREKPFAEVRFDEKA